MLTYTFNLGDDNFKVNSDGDILTREEKEALTIFWAGTPQDCQVIYWASCPFYVVDHESGECHDVASLP